MKVKISIDLYGEMSDEGYPVILKVSHAQKRTEKTIGYSFKEHWSDEAETITPKHPDYDILAPKIMDYKTKGRQLVIQNRITEPKLLLEEIIKKANAGVTFMEFYADLLEQMEDLRKRFDKRGDVVNRNKISGNIKVYENAVAQFNLVVKDVPLAELDYPTLLDFKNYQQRIGNKKNTVHQYLRTIRAIYNKGILVHKIFDNKPFKGIFSGLTVKSYGNKKKYLTKDTVRLLEGLVLPPGQRMYVDLFLLQFYFGGSDLTDIYYLKKAQVRKGRVYFERGKTTNELMIDLKVHPKAKAILEKYPSADEWQFPWRKDEAGYVTFRRRLQKILKTVQEKQDTIAEQLKDEALRIDVMPMGGNLGIKVARHTFANIGKELMIEPDILRELMGHERNEVDNFYKDRYPQAVRDEAHFRIID